MKLPKLSATALITTLLFLLTTALAYTYVNHPEKLPRNLGGVHTPHSFGLFHSQMTLSDVEEVVVLGKDSKSSGYMVSEFKKPWPLNPKPSNMLLEFDDSGLLATIVAAYVPERTIADVSAFYTERENDLVDHLGDTTHRSCTPPKALFTAIEDSYDEERNHYLFWQSLGEMWGCYSGWQEESGAGGTLLRMVPMDERPRVLLLETYKWNGHADNFETLLKKQRGY